MNFRRLGLALAVILTPVAAQAQSYLPFFAQYNYVPTPAQWIQAWQAKQDVLGYTPCNTAGCSITGELWTAASTATQAGLNIGTGTGPTAPMNGDVWETTLGLFAQINNVTVGPFVASLTLSGDVSSVGPVVTFNTVNSSPGTVGGAGYATTVTVNGKGLVTAATQTAIADMVGFRNRIINGGDPIDQRNNFASQTITAGAALLYTDDRFFVYSTGANVTGQVVNRGVTALKQYQITGAASVTGITRCQRIESYSSADLAGGNATFGVDLSDSLLTSVSWALSYANTQDTFGTIASPTVTAISSGAFTVSSSLTRFTTTVAIPSAAVTGLQICLSVGAQISGTFVSSNWQLEQGSIATSFERRPMATEYNLAQYFWRWIPFNIQGQAASTGTGGIIGATATWPTMRSTPVLSSVSTDPNASSASSNCTGAAQQPTPYGAQIICTPTATGNVYVNGYRFSANAEL